MAIVELSDPRTMERIRPELDRGERVLWIGRPDPVALGWRRGGLVVLFLIPWTGFALFWTFMATGGFRTDAGFGVFGLVWGGMFILVGAGMFVRTLLPIAGAWSTVYAVTDRRALILGTGKVSSYGPAELGSLVRTGGSRRGSLVFGTAQAAAQARTGRALHAGGPDTGFVGIENPREVERLIRERVRPQQG